VRERIISAELKKLELRQRREAAERAARDGNSKDRPEGRRGS
jgi:hypothetical protein